MNTQTMPSTHSRSAQSLTLKGLITEKLKALVYLQEKRARRARAKQLDHLAYEHQIAAGTLKSIMNEVQQRPEEEAVPYILRQAELTKAARWVQQDLNMMALHIKSWLVGRAQAA